GRWLEQWRRRPAEADLGRIDCATRMSTDDVLLGLGLVLSLAVSAQLVAARLRLPAIVVLLPAGFLAGIATDDVDPAKLLGALYQPFVSVAVGVVLFEAGLRLSLRDIAPEVRRTVARLIAIGVLVTWAGVAATAALLFDGFGVGVPLLAFVRPAHHLRTLLMWEGVLVDPIGALLGVLVFGAVRSAAAGDRAWHP